MSADRRTVLALTGALLAGAAGCAGTTDPDDTDDADNGTEDDPFDGYETPEFPRIEPTTDHDIETDLLAEQVRDNVDFALALLAQLRADEPDENLLFSPYSVSVALAMTYAGARGGTAAEMGEALRYVLEGEDLHAAFGALEAEFAQRNRDGEDVDPGYPEEDGDEDEDDLGFQLSSANATWADEGYPFAEAYLDLLEAYYEAGDHLVDFSGSPEEARREINAWVEERTNDRIVELLPADSISSATRLVLTNAVYFLAAWEYEFDPADTEREPFTSLDGTETDVELMHQREELSYAQIDGHQLVELPYANGDTSMVVVLPAEGGFESFEESFDVDRLATMLEETSRPEVDLALPKFGIESKFSLVETMQELGMERAFTGSAEFGGMTDPDTNELFIAEIVHQSFVEVDEEGTEAAAATGVVMDETAAPEPPERVEMTVDRPFLFYVRDRPTETPLFVGRVVGGETLQDE